MKKLLTLILLATIFIACSKDDDNNTDNNFIDPNLVGVQWRLTEEGGDQVWIFNNTQRNMYGIVSEIDKTIGFISNGTYNYTTTIEGKITIGENKYTYKIDGNKLTIYRSKSYDLHFTKIQGYTIID